SVEIPGASGTTTDDFSEILTTIAKEEMGHLLTVQNLLRLIGGSPWFERDNFPARTELYPFRFTLERLSKGSLAKYVFAEMTPGDVPENVLSAADKADITARAMVAAEVGAGGFTNHVGTLYNTIQYTFEHELNDPGDFRTNRNDWQCSGWSKTDANIAILKKIKLVPTRNKQEALGAIKVIAQQGEAFDPANPADSHFQRFLDLYRLCPEDTSSFVLPVWKNPTTNPGGDAVIQEPTTLLWAKLFNIRYRILLAELAHIVAIPATAEWPSPGGQN